MFISVPSAAGDDCSWVASTLRAMRSDAASIILPSSEAAPLPWLSASFSASIMRGGAVDLLSGGEKISLASAIWLGMDRPLAFDAEGCGTARSRL